MGYLHDKELKALEKHLQLVKRCHQSYELAGTLDIANVTAGFTARMICELSAGKIPSGTMKITTATTNSMSKINH